MNSKPGDNRHGFLNSTPAAVSVSPSARIASTPNSAPASVQWPESQTRTSRPSDEGRQRGTNLPPTRTRRRSDDRCRPGGPQSAPARSLHRASAAASRRRRTNRSETYTRGELIRARRHEVRAVNVDRKLYSACLFATLTTPKRTRTFALSVWNRLSMPNIESTGAAGRYAADCSRRPRSLQRVFGYAWPRSRDGQSVIGDPAWRPYCRRRSRSPPADRPSAPARRRCSRPSQPRGRSRTAS